jgi:hypothetical protein
MIGFYDANKTRESGAAAFRYVFAKRPEVYCMDANWCRANVGIWRAVAVEPGLTGRQARAANGRTKRWRTRQGERIRDSEDFQELTPQR